MKKKKSTRTMKQQNLFETPPNPPPRNNFISVYRVSLIKDQPLEFDQKEPIINSSKAQEIIQHLIQTRGQPDREQLCIALLNAKNQLIGVNIVSTGTLTSAVASPREILKPAILANAAAIILGHNHPSNDVTPSGADIALTKRIIQASHVMDIQIHEHLIINMENNIYYSFADQGLISSYYSEARLSAP